eukprot:58050-Amphidinium_carterae.2
MLDERVFNSHPRCASVGKENRAERRCENFRLQLAIAGKPVPFLLESVCIRIHAHRFQACGDGIVLIQDPSLAVPKVVNFIICSSSPRAPRGSVEV